MRLGHVVERRRQPPELIVRLHGNRMTEVAALDPLGSAEQLVHRGGDRPRQRQAVAERDDLDHEQQDADTDERVEQELVEAQSRAIVLSGAEEAIQRGHIDAHRHRRPDRLAGLPIGMREERRGVEQRPAPIGAEADARRGKRPVRGRADRREGRRRRPYGSRPLPWKRDGARGHPVLCHHEPAEGLLPSATAADRRAGTTATDTPGKRGRNRRLTPGDDLVALALRALNFEEGRPRERARLFGQRRSCGSAPDRSRRRRRSEEMPAART